MSGSEVDLTPKSIQVIMPRWIQTKPVKIITHHVILSYPLISTFRIRNSRNFGLLATCKDSALRSNSLLYEKILRISLFY